MVIQTHVAVKFRERLRQKRDRAGLQAILRDAEAAGHAFALWGGHAQGLRHSIHGSFFSRSSTG